MTKRRFIATSVLGCALTTGFIWSAASGVTPLTNGVSETVYRPIESISYTLGSKKAIGYFSKDAERCNVTLMVAEAVDPDQEMPGSAARLRLALTPGQEAGLDSEEGQSIQMICGSGAETLVVLRGDTAVFRAATN